MKNKVTASVTKTTLRIEQISHGQYFRVEHNQGETLFLRAHDGAVRLEDGEFFQLTDTYTFPNYSTQRFANILATPLKRGEVITVEVA